jgi:hypothetical protein
LHGENCPRTCRKSWKLKEIKIWWGRNPPNPKPPRLLAYGVLGHTPSWVRPGTDCGKIQPSVGRTRGGLLKKTGSAKVIASAAKQSHLRPHNSWSHLKEDRTQARRKTIQLLCYYISEFCILASVFCLKLYHFVFFHLPGFSNIPLKYFTWNPSTFLA